jgi:hypothetical protein
MVEYLMAQSMILSYVLWCCRGPQVKHFSLADDASLLTVYIRIKLQVDLQADKSSVVVKGPFFLQV